jgi:hypothetical protein
MIARENAREAEWKARREKEAAEASKRRREEKELEDEIARQRDRAKRDEFEKRIDVLTLGEKRFTTNAEKEEFLEDVTRALVRMLVAEEGPMVRARIQNMHPSDAVSVLSSEGRRNPDPIVRDKTQTVCDTRTIPDWRARCGELLKRNVLTLPVVMSRFYLSVLVNAAPFTASK